MWDKDITADDCGGECSVSLTRWMKRIYKRGTFTPYYWNAVDENEEKGEKKGGRFQFKPNETGYESLGDVAESLLSKEPLLGEEDEEVRESKFWWPLMRPAESREKGKVWGYDGNSPPMLLISVQIVPEQKFEELPCGHGRWGGRPPSPPRARAPSLTLAILPRVAGRSPMRTPCCPSPSDVSPSLSTPSRSSIRSASPPPLSRRLQSPPASSPPPAPRATASFLPSCRVPCSDVPPSNAHARTLAFSGLCVVHSCWARSSASASRV